MRQPACCADAMSATAAACPPAQSRQRCITALSAQACSRGAVCACQVESTQARSYSQHVALGQSDGGRSHTVPPSVLSSHAAVTDASWAASRPRKWGSACCRRWPSRDADTNCRARGRCSGVHRLRKWHRSSCSRRLCFSGGATPPTCTQQQLLSAVQPMLCDESLRRRSASTIPDGPQYWGIGAGLRP